MKILALSQIFAFCFLFIIDASAQPDNTIHILSPDKTIRVNFYINALGKAFYTVQYRGKEIIHPSQLGLKRDDADFSSGLRFINATPVTSVTDSYELFTGKKKLVQYKANKRITHLQNANNNKLDIIFQVSNAGVGFRYYFPDRSGDIKKVTEELTTFHFDKTTKAFLQPMQKAKTGWQQSNPAYEANYVQDVPVGTVSPTGWIYPALFHNGNTWMLLTEAGMDGKYCATKLWTTEDSSEYKISFPDEKETMEKDGLVPRSALPFYSPWRIITIGSLKTIMESSLGTDLAAPSIKIDKSFIKPGKSSWSWIMSKDDSIVYSEQKRYVDFAADMHWNYCLVDANWDQKIGYEKIKELADYAAGKKVGLILWYNSSGDWNTVTYTPKSKLLTHADRVKEFARLKQMGIKGVKIDFFAGDGQSVIQYYIDILKDAADFGLLVNFHGATLPRGWSRTYPNLVSVEAVKGFEMITFNQADADREANHCTVLPFTRNVSDPMDFTPMNLYKITTNVQRKTTSAFELATSVIFLSGIQHFAESPDGMKQVPAYVKNFLRELPDRWDDVKFLDGYPGKLVILARKAGNKWYIAGINGLNEEQTVNINLQQFGKHKVQLITEGTDQLSFSNQQIAATTAKQIVLKASGGFVMVLE